MKVAFVNPRYYEENYRYKVNKLSPPLGMAMLSSMLRLHDHEAKIFDLEALKTTITEQIASIAEFGPDIIGVFGTSPINKYMQECIAVLRQHFPHSIMVVGGPHATLFPEAFFNHTNAIDYVFRGEAEYAFTEFVEQVAQFDAVTFPEKIEGIVYKDNGRLFKHPVTPKIEDLDALPFPAYDLLPLERYYETGSNVKTITMMTSRGCPYDCIYCAAPVLYGRKYRSRSPEHVVEEMKYLYLDHGIRHIVFYDANFNADIKRVKQICQHIIDAQLDLTWRARVRADNIDEESVKMMKAAGCTELSLGVESGSDKMLKIMNKKESKAEIRKAFQIIKEHGVGLVGYFMFGLPEETPKEADETIRFAIELDPDWALFSSATPLPGTKFLYMAEASDWIISTDLNNYKANFDNPVVSYPHFTSNEIKAYINKAYDQFYVRKDWLMNRLKKAKNNAQIINILNSFKFYYDKLHVEEQGVI